MGNIIKPKILLSIIVPVYNSAKFIRTTLTSLVKLIGNRMDIEVIVQDACSTDTTSSIVREFVGKYKSIYHFIEKDNGQSDGINKGARKAKGLWITWLCADDLLLSPFLKCISLLQSTEVDVIYGDCIMLMENGAFTPAIGTETYTRGALAKKRMILQQPGTCIRKALWDIVGGVNERLNWTMDYDLFLRLESKKALFKRMEEFVAIARIHADAKTSSGSKKRLFEHWKILFNTHIRNITYFSMRPYILYTIEYIIKYRESQSKLKGISKLHEIFWRLGLPTEKEQIIARFQARRSDIQTEIALLDKGQSP